MIAVLSEDAYPNLITSLRNYGEVILLPKNQSLLEPESKHSDMQIFKTSNNSCLIHPSISIDVKNKLSKNNIKFDIDDSTYSPEYPKCIRLNGLRCKNYVFAKEDYISKNIIDKFSVINVNQGYAGCSGTYIDSINTIITSDKSIYNKVTQYGFNAYIIDNSKIELPGYNCGFFGGCLGYSSKNNILFVNGSISMNYPELYNFLKDNVKIVECNQNLLDIGGITLFD